LLVIALILLVMLHSALRLLSIPILVLWAILARAAPLPDLMIAPDGRMALFRAEAGGYALLSPGTPSTFTLQQWLPSIGDPRLPADPSLRKDVSCDRFGCTGRTASGQRISLSLTPESVRQDCQRAGLIISPRQFPAAACNNGTTLLAEESHRRYGAQRIMLDGARIRARETSLDPNISRPWRRTQSREPTEIEPAPRPSEALGGPNSPRGTDVPSLPDDEPALVPPTAQ
jgi:competence protein ComEC